jgi:hypothetical protein
MSISRFQQVGNGTSLFCEAVRRCATTEILIDLLTPYTVYFADTRPLEGWLEISNDY